MAKQYYIGILALLLTSCATSPIALSDVKAVLPKGETIVFGRVKVISEGKTMNWGVLKPPFSLHVLSERGPGPDPYMLTGDGTFLWHFSPGGYTITEFHRGGWRQKIRRVFAYFAIPEGTALVYIGTLKITLETERDLISIEDDYEHALQRFKNKFPEIKGDATKSLMHLEKAR